MLKLEDHKQVAKGMSGVAEVQVELSAADMHIVLTRHLTTGKWSVQVQDTGFSDPARHDKPQDEFFVRDNITDEQAGALMFLFAQGDDGIEGTDIVSQLYVIVAPVVDGCPHNLRPIP